MARYTIADVGVNHGLNEVTFSTAQGTTARWIELATNQEAIHAPGWHVHEIDTIFDSLMLRRTAAAEELEAERAALVAA